MSTGSPGAEDAPAQADAPSQAEHGASSRYASQDQLRAMAHPLRLDIMERMGRRGTARAADLAADLGIPANSVSYHLRILARGGVIEEAPEAARDRRDRVWRLAQDTYALSGAQARVLNDPESQDSEYLDASGATALAAFEWMRSAFSAELARSRSADAPPEDGLGQMITTSMRLSREQMIELSARVDQTMQEYLRLNRDEHGVDLAGDPDSDGAALTFRTMWVAVGEQSAVREGDSQRPEGSSSSSSTASPS